MRRIGRLTALVLALGFALAAPSAARAQSQNLGFCARIGEREQVGGILRAYAPGDTSRPQRLDSAKLVIFALIPDAPWCVVSREVLFKAAPGLWIIAPDSLEKQLKPMAGKRVCLYGRLSFVNAHPEAPPFALDVERIMNYC